MAGRRQGAPRRRVLAVHLGFAFCFAALYLFHLILYNYNFSDLEGLALKDYDRYLAPYYQAWMLAMLCLLARGARERLAQLATGGTAAVILPYSAGAVCPRRASGPVPTACTRCAPTCRTAPIR